tara:strand:- start:768 stop:1166 length:399 start_codon:yes stop_codon:yes gene_type:complete
MDSIVLLIDNVASGNNTFDNCINVLYVSCVNETFLYLVISVIVTFLSFISDDYIGSIGELSSMKFMLALVICSQVQQTCLTPYQWPDTFNSQYDCLMFGYEESMKKMKEIGRTEINKHGMFIKFYCTSQQII